MEAESKKADRLGRVRVFAVHCPFFVSILSKIFKPLQLDGVKGLLWHFMI